MLFLFFFWIGPLKESDLLTAFVLLKYPIPLRPLEASALPKRLDSGLQNVSDSDWRCPNVYVFFLFWIGPLKVSDWWKSPTYWQRLCNWECLTCLGSLKESSAFGVWTADIVSNRLKCPRNLGSLERSCWKQGWKIQWFFKLEISFF